MLFLLLVAAVQDVKNGKISNRIILIGLISGFSYQVAEQGFVGIILFLWNISVPVILFFLIFLKRALGAGDIKLFSMVGSMVTLHQLLLIIKAAFVFGSIWGLFYLIAKKEKRQIPFAPAIALGSIAVVIATR